MSYRAGVRALVEQALTGTPLDLIGSLSAAEWDARAPSGLDSQSLLPGARGAIVVGNAGPALFRAFRSADHRGDHPLDAFVGTMLDRVDAAFARAGVRARRFEPTVVATPRLDFRTLAELAGLGTPGPFGISIHATHGPWWALRGAWLVDREVASTPKTPSPCASCARPCLGGARDVAIGESTVAMRLACPIGQHSRYDDDAIAYHHQGLRPVWMLTR